MFVPPYYREPHGSWVVDLVRGHPLALLVSEGGDAGVPFATHLPVIPAPSADGGPHGELSGSVLLGHMNRANPHWKALASGGRAVLVFSGPHGYVSPTVYQTSPAAPTWNFSAVHALGTLELIDSAEETLEVVAATVRAFEAGFGTGWDQTESLPYFRKILPGVGAFRFTVLRTDGMFKLSQEQAPEVRARVQESFSAHECSGRRATASLMCKLP